MISPTTISKNVLTSLLGGTNVSPPIPPPPSCLPPTPTHPLTQTASAEASNNPGPTPPLHFAFTGIQAELPINPVPLSTAK